MTAAVTRYLAKEMVPIYTVNKASFRSMVETLNPRYDLPHKDYFSRIAIPCLYEETRQSLEKKLASLSSNADFFFSATTDLWSSRTSDPFLAYTVHYIDAEWQLQSHCLKVLYVPQDHTSDNIQEVLDRTLQDWKLDPAK